MVQIKNILAVAALYLAYSYYKRSNSKILDSPVIHTQSGSLQGITSLSRDGREFYEYLGIPYATPPTGPLRFQSPLPVEKWDGIRDAGSYGSICLQVDRWSRQIHGDENCLFLNVFVPMIKNTKTLPVMLWIHGGMWVSGSSKIYRPEYLMDQDIILVTINYRLGSLGFLSTGDELVRGNMALKDQNMAMRWVKENIQYFAGDPNRVTIFGESAGGASVHHHILSPKSKGLFQRAISQSASILAGWTTSFIAVEQGQHYSKKLNCPTESSKAMVDCLMSKTGVELMEASYPDLLNPLRDPKTIFNPSIEVVKDEDAFIIQHPIEILRKGDFNKVPFMTGMNDAEGLLISAPLVRDNLLTKVNDENFYLHFSNILWESGGANPAALREVTMYYFGDDRVDLPEKFDNWTNVITDSGFGGPLQIAIDLHSEANSPIYAYYFTYKGEFSLVDILFAISGKYPPALEHIYYFLPRWFQQRILGIKLPHLGACHVDEVALIFPLPGMSYIAPSDRDYQMSKLMVKAWVSFAGGDPTARTLQFNGVNWPHANRLNGQPPKYMHIDVTSSIIDEPNYERNTFWANLKLARSRDV